MYNVAFDTGRGLGQVDSLAAMLFEIVLEKALRAQRHNLHQVQSGASYQLIPLVDIDLEITMDGMTSKI